MVWEKRIGILLRERQGTVAIAESCTGGKVSDRLTNVPGSSDYVEGGILSYSPRAKVDHLFISPTVLKRFGAVSPQVAKRMAEGVRKAFHTTFGLSTTGVAGPGGGSPRTPVGLVFMALSDGKRCVLRRECFRGNRGQIKRQAAEKCLRFFHDALKKNELSKRKRRTGSHRAKPGTPQAA
jgi:PncC family amidohydrolase